MEDSIKDMLRVTRDHCFELADKQKEEDSIMMIERFRKQLEVPKHDSIEFTKKQLVEQAELQTRLIAQGRAILKGNK